MSGRLESKVALVTGGSSGLGKASALALAREGAKVVVSDVDSAGGKETVEMIQESGGEAIFVKADVAEEAEVEILIDEAVRVYLRMDCAFNNAGIHGDDWDRVMSINLKGMWLCMKYELPQMIKQGGGAIVNTSSILGLVGGRISAYSVSKHGIIGLTRAAALKYAKDNIRVNAVCPGFMRTHLMAPILANKSELDKIIAATPMKRIADPSEIAEAVVWLLSDAASFVTGIAMPVDGGYTAQ